VTDQATLVAHAPPAEEVSRRRTGAVDRWSVWVFAVAVVAALPLLLWFGRDHWFYLDEWQILGADGVTRTGYLDGHNGHWITLLRLEYRLTFELWGLRSYVPYQVPAILGHLASAVLVRQICRRVGARDWIATAAALAFLFFGSGRENMTLGFQVSLTGSLICGFGMLLLAEGPKTVTRRDWLALGLGVVGLMTSSVFVAVLVGFGITTLLRRGVRLAAFYTVPLGAIYMAWYAAYGDESGLPVKLTDETARYFRRVLWAVLDALARGGVGAFLLALMVVGLAGALLRARRFHRWADAALPVGLCAAWLAFAGLTALTRAEFGAAFPIGGRLLHVSAALVLPLVAAGAEELARRRSLLGVAALVPLAIGLPRNLDRLSETSILFRTSPELASAVAYSPFIDDAPENLMPLQDNNAFHPPATAEWLASQAAAGRIPKPDEPVPPQLELTATSRLVLAQAPDTSGQPACPSLTAPVTASLESGDEIPFIGAIQVTVTDGTHESAPRRFFGWDHAVVRALAGPLDVVVRSVPEGPGWVCPPSS
jgi:hypothetical protein